MTSDTPRKLFPALIVTFFGSAVGGLLYIGRSRIAFSLQGLISLAFIWIFISELFLSGSHIRRYYTRQHHF